MGRQRHSLPGGRSKKIFRKTARKVHKKNSVRPMRGGIRL